MKIKNIMGMGVVLSYILFCYSYSQAKNIKGTESEIITVTNTRNGKVKTFTVESIKKLMAEIYLICYFYENNTRCLGCDNSPVNSEIDVLEKRLVTINIEELETAYDYWTFQKYNPNSQALISPYIEAYREAKTIVELKTWIINQKLYQKDKYTK